MMSNLDIRMAGLGGQGVVTAAHILGTAIVKSDKYATVNPFFGAEKRLAPAESYVRISDKPIYDRGEILYPDFIMVFAPEVITMGKSYSAPFYSGLKENGFVLINSDKPILSDEEKAGLEKLNAKVINIPATSIALEYAGTELATNMTMLGAFSALVDFVKFDEVINAVKERFGGNEAEAKSVKDMDENTRRKYEKALLLIEKNTTAVIKAYDYTKDKIK